jgi:hypothetical protein
MSRDRRRRGTAAAALALAAAVLLAACGTETLTFGVVLLPIAVDASNPTDCAGTGPWADIHSGAAVIVTDAAGATMGSTSLPRGVTSGAFLPGDPRSCRFDVHIGRLPERSSYTVTFGKQEWLFDQQLLIEMAKGPITLGIP